MGFNSKRFISTRYFSSTLLFFSTIPPKEVYKNRIKVGVDEKKKTQGMRRDSAHFYGPSPLFSLFFFTPFLVVCFLGGRKMDEKENWEVGDKIG